MLGFNNSSDENNNETTNNESSFPSIFTNSTNDSLSEEENNPVDSSNSVENIPTIKQADDELTTIIDQVDSLTFTNQVIFDKTAEISAKTMEEVAINAGLNFDFDADYNTINNNQIIKDLVIELGTNKLPRFSCACHKLNLAIRQAISKHKPLSKIILKLNKCNKHFRRTIALSRILRQKKCRLRTENLTRWSSTYLMLESIKKAYDREAFSEENKCPVDMKTIEVYLQIPRPAYQFMLGLQYTSSTIAQVLVGVLKLAHKWETIDLKGDVKNCSIMLLACLKKKFSFELDSNLYKVI